jgi:transposase
LAAPAGCAAEGRERGVARTGAGAAHERERLRGAVDDLLGEQQRLNERNQQLGDEVERLRERNERLRGEVEALRRAAKRQAASFSKDTPVANPKRCGRKPGVAHGRHAHRQPPTHVDRVVEVDLPACCPGCGGGLVVERVAAQCQEEVPPVRPLVTCFQVQVGRCRGCGRRIQPRHPQQTSDALGAAAVQLGPRAVALAAWCSKGLGVPAAKTARLLSQLGIAVTPGGVTQAVARAARRVKPTYQALAQGVRASPVVAPDETGWRVGGRRAWLWAFVGKGVTVYRIAAGRGYHDAAVVLGEGYGGVLERDGWAPYRKFTAAAHQSCLAHLLRRCRELIGDAVAGQAKTPHAVRRLLEHALALRTAHQAGTLDRATLAAEADRLDAQVDKLIAGATHYPPNRRLLGHLANERGNLFTFLRLGGVEATNWRAEHAIRPAVVCRKAWGGNRTWAGADTWQVLASVLRTASQQHRDPIGLLTRLLQAPVPMVAPISPSQHPSALIGSTRRRRANSIRSDQPVIAPHRRRADARAQGQHTGGVRRGPRAAARGGEGAHPSQR